jgi:hypothetical protein
MAARIEHIHVSWTQKQDVEAYVDDYLQRRKRPVQGTSRAAVLRCMDRYVGNRAITRADLDFYLDANLRALCG